MKTCRNCDQRSRAHDAGRAEGPVVTACQQACPTRAIVFGDAADPASEVARALASPRAYAALGELGTVPRTRYLAKIVERDGAA
jgi:Fe-S-cluster-containing dehydrogenase component